MSRRQLREAVFLTLFQTAFSPKETEPDNIVEEIIQANIEEFELIAAPADAAYISETVKAVLAYSDKSDEIINRYSKTRKVGRIAKVNAAVMRLALYEMDCIDDDKVPPKVAMNEGIELAKKYADDKDCKFISGLIGAYYKDKYES